MSNPERDSEVKEAVKKSTRFVATLLVLGLTIGLINHVLSLEELKLQLKWVTK